MFMKLILASQSPRRRDILKNARIPFEVVATNLSEVFAKNLTLDQQIMELAERKARACQTHLGPNASDILILGADTVVVCEERVLGKPSSPDEAKHFLRLLSGRVHSVKTGICFLHCFSSSEASPSLPVSEKLIAEIDTTFVYFKRLNEKEIQKYVDSGEPFDKAGGYGIQGGAAAFIEKIEGSYHNVVGLPIERVQRILTEQNWKL